MMDDDEKRILEEANALRQRELDLRQSRIDKTFAVGRLGMLLWLALAATTLGVIGLAQLDLPWRRAISFTAAVASALVVGCWVLREVRGFLNGNCPTTDPVAARIWAALFVICVFVSALTCPDAWWT